MLLLVEVALELAVLDMCLHQLLLQLRPRSNPGLFANAKLQLQECFEIGSKI